MGQDENGNEIADTVAAAAQAEVDAANQRAQDAEAAARALADVSLEDQRNARFSEIEGRIGTWEQNQTERWAALEAQQAERDRLAEERHQSLLSRLETSILPPSPPPPKENPVEEAPALEAVVNPQQEPPIAEPPPAPAKPKRRWL